MNYKNVNSAFDLDFATKSPIIFCSSFIIVYRISKNYQNCVYQYIYSLISMYISILFLNIYQATYRFSCLNTYRFLHAKIYSRQQIVRISNFPLRKACFLSVKQCDGLWKTFLLRHWRLNSREIFSLLVPVLNLINIPITFGLYRMDAVNSRQEN